jgi:hypothetical protein
MGITESLFSGNHTRRGCSPWCRYCRIVEPISKRIKEASLSAENVFAIAIKVLINLEESALLSPKAIYDSKQERR